MKKLNITWSGITDTTGYLFSFAKSLSCAVKNSPYAELSEDIIASSGFAFRMWVNAESLCPSATSIWEFKKQKPWVENGGLICDYVERLWGQDDIEEERRLQAIDLIKKSIDKGIPVVSWDISGCEWGLVTGYDDEARKLATLKIQGNEDEISYDVLGKMDLPILSVLAITGRTEKSSDEIVADTKKLAAKHLKGSECCENPLGLAAYPALIGYIKDKFTPDVSWNLEYYLGTYAALKYYAWKFFEKYGEAELCELYQKIHKAWQSAFEIKKTKDAADDAVKSEIVNLLSEAYESEKTACDLMEKGV